MNEFPYGRLPDAYLNVKEAAKDPWRGITAWVQGNPYLVIDKTDDAYILEGENGLAFEGSSFERWSPATEHSALVAASRLEDSPFARGLKAGNQEIGNLVFFEKEWDVTLGDLDVALPIETLVERYDKIRWSKTADLYPGMDYRCPECGSHNVDLTNDDFTTEPQSEWGGIHAMTCHDCGYEGADREFQDEEPDYDQDPRYEYDAYSSVKEAEGVNSFEYNLPPAGIHMRSHAAMKNAGLQARVHFPPGLEGMFGPIPEVLDVPTNDQQAAMATMMLDNPEQYTVHVETPHDPEQVRQLLDQVGGRTASTKMGEANENVDDPIVDSQKALKCPKCGSHSLRAFSPTGNETTIVCLTCGNEFQHAVHMNPESSVKEAVTPIDPNMSAQVIGLMQQIEEAYQQGDHNRAQQLHQQMMALMNNPNTPLMNTTKVADYGYGLGPQYPNNPEQQQQIAALMNSITNASASGDVQALRQLRARLEQLLGGNPAYAKRQSADIPLRPDQVDNIGDTRVLSYTMPGGDRGSITVHAENMVLAIKDLVDRGAVDIHIGGERDDTPGDLTLPQSWGSLIKEAPGNKHLPYATPKRNRQYEHILESCRKEHPDWSEDRCKELAARTVNKERAEKGETKSSVEDCGCDDTITNDKLSSTVEEYSLDTLTYDPKKPVKYADSYWDGAGDPYGGQPVNLDSYEMGGTGLDPTFDSGSDMDYAHCPQCDGPGNLLGALGGFIHYRCRNCGLDFHRDARNDMNQDLGTQDVGPQRSDPYGQAMASVDDAKEVNDQTLKAFKDSSGNPLEAGKVYRLHHPSYKVPDLVRILNLEDNRVEAAIASDEHGAFPIHITHDGGYSLEPYSEHKKASGWSVVARRNFTAQEQRELIDENPKGRARNFDKLDLDGTHYQVKEEATDPNFLLGW